MLNEIWLPVPEWENFYTVSNYGRCFSIRTNKIKPLDPNTYGYLRLQCYDGNRRQKLFVHKLVATLFVPGYFEGAVVNHIDGDKTNNIYTNLEWVTKSRNLKHAYEIGTMIPKKKDQPVVLVTKDGTSVYFPTAIACARSIGISDKRLHHLIKKYNGYVPEIGGYVSKCVSND